MRGRTGAEQEQDTAMLLSAVGSQQDIIAYEKLFRHFGPRVKAYMTRVSRDPQLSEELMQETMIAVWNKAGRFDPARGEASTWIFTIARNLRIDALRREKRPQFDPDDPAFVRDDVFTDEALDVQQSTDRLQRAIEALPVEQADLVKASFFDDESQSAIAKRLKLPLGTVKSRMRLAFEKLRAALIDSGGQS
jgi:RNA polymerase sigma-70 factor (ECF subfamily)